MTGGSISRASQLFTKPTLKSQIAYTEKFQKKKNRRLDSNMAKGKQAQSQRRA